MSHQKKTNTRESIIKMLPSKGKPNLGAAAKLMVPVILEAIHNSDNKKKSEDKKHTHFDEGRNDTASSD